MGTSLREGAMNKEPKATGSSMGTERSGARGRRASQGKASVAAIAAGAVIASLPVVVAVLTIHATLARHAEASTRPTRVAVVKRMPSADFAFAGGSRHLRSAVSRVPAHDTQGVALADIKRIIHSTCWHACPPFRLLLPAKSDDTDPWHAARPFIDPSANHDDRACREDCRLRDARP